MNDAVLDNPAARLDFWLRMGRPEADMIREMRHGRRGHDGRSYQIRETWAKIWHLDIEDPDELVTLHENGMTLIKEARQVRQVVSESPSPFAAHALAHFDQIEECVAHFVRMESATMDQMFNPVEQGGWHSLPLLSTLLREEAPEIVPPDETREDLIAQTHGLVQNVLADEDLDAATKTQIVDALLKVQDSLVRFKIGGAPVVEEASDRLAGSLVRSVLLRGREALDHPTTRAVFVLLGAISAAFGIPADYLAISAGFAGEIGPGE
ncbi:MAG: hypothetical protein PGN07_06820 [Aeromicrobium erythreum]